MNSAPPNKDLVLVSGYYGFGNLGDEAILEEIVAELTRLVERETIVILSQNPESTSRTYSVRAVNRWNLKELAALFGKAKLFVSGGGGLYQDTSSVRSIVYYAGLAFLARAAGVPTIIYAQGVGPLNSTIAKTLTRAAISQAATIAVRDKASFEMLKNWGLAPVLTADPVWCLQSTDLPQTIASQLAGTRQRNADSLLIGLSLRKTHDIMPGDIEKMVPAIIEATPANSILVPLSLFPEQDDEFLECARLLWERSGRQVLITDSGELRPSQWLKLIGQLDLMVAMRFHALLMALRSGVACVGLAYDPKVAYLMERFAQPCLRLDEIKGDDANNLRELVEQSTGNRAELGAYARELSVQSEALACQNFDLLAKILNMQSAGKIQREP